MNTNTDLAIKYINSNSLTGIKAGKDRLKFLDIWMVVVDNRIFARSWGFAEKSWFNTFLNDPSGKIKCGDQEFSITAKIPNDLNRINAKISAAYLAKYNHGENAEYAIGITREQHLDKTMEFIIS